MDTKIIEQPVTQEQKTDPDASQAKDDSPCINQQQSQGNQIDLPQSHLLLSDSQLDDQFITHFSHMSNNPLSQFDKSGYLDNLLIDQANDQDTNNNHNLKEFQTTKRAEELLRLSQMSRNKLQTQKSQDSNITKNKADNGDKQQQNGEEKSKAKWSPVRGKTLVVDHYSPAIVDIRMMAPLIHQSQLQTVKKVTDKSGATNKYQSQIIKLNKTDQQAIDNDQDKPNQNHDCTEKSDAQNTRKQLLNKNNTLESLSSGSQVFSRKQSMVSLGSVKTTVINNKQYMKDKNIEGSSLGLEKWPDIIKQQQSSQGEVSTKKNHINMRSQSQPAIEYKSGDSASNLDLQKQSLSSARNQDISDHLPLDQPLPMIIQSNHKHFEQRSKSVSNDQYRSKLGAPDTDQPPLDYSSIVNASSPLQRRLSQDQLFELERHKNLERVRMQQLQRNRPVRYFQSPQRIGQTLTLPEVVGMSKKTLIETEDSPMLKITKNLMQKSKEEIRSRKRGLLRSPIIKKADIQINPQGNLQQQIEDTTPLTINSVVAPLSNRKNQNSDNQDLQQHVPDQLLQHISQPYNAKGQLRTIKNMKLKPSLAQVTESSNPRQTPSAQSNFIQKSKNADLAKVDLLNNLIFLTKIQSI